MLAVRTVLHPTDFSAHSQAAFRIACSLARDYGARLVVLHVAPPPVVVTDAVLVAWPSVEDRKPLLDKLGHLRPQDPNVAVEHRLAEGDEAGEILRAAREVGADVVVMGTHGRSGLGRALMGSVAEQVVRKAPCPVLTVKTPPAAAPATHDAAPESAEAASV
jgi:nucleotide-binding universal stress UspA family protein